MKRILFVVNTMGQAGAETALIGLLKEFDHRKYHIYLYVLMEQGELIDSIPSYVTLLNRDYSNCSVLSGKGRWKMAERVVKCFFKNGGLLEKMQDMAKIFLSMCGMGNFQVSKLLWRMISDGADRFDLYFDLAVAWLEGSSAYYVADHVKARTKAAFIHTDYKRAGYTREMDRGCWGSFQQIFTVSWDARKHFLEIYPEYEDKVSISCNTVDREAIYRKSREPGGFTDHFEGIRLLTVGRLTYEKGHDIAIDALKILKDSGYPIRWYVLGEGNKRSALKKKIAALKLDKDFILLGAVKNPYPYYVQADIYVHASRYEGSNIAAMEAQLLGCAVIASDCSGNRERVIHMEDGILCELEPQAIADSIAELLKNREKRERLGRRAAMKELPRGHYPAVMELLG